MKTIIKLGRALASEVWALTCALAFVVACIWDDLLHPFKDDGEA